MSSDTMSKPAPINRSRFPIGRRFKAYLQTSILALACIAIAGPAFARTAFDGDWSVVIATSGGACEPTFRYPIAISNGAVINAGSGVASVQGRVRPNGKVQVLVQSGNQWADGSGRLDANRGSGIWRGQGSSGACEGTWVATRRGGVPYAERTGAPIYNYVPPAAVAPSRVPSATVAACEARFRSYNPATGTYLGFDGARHPCR